MSILFIEIDELANVGNAVDGNGMSDTEAAELLALCSQSNAQAYNARYERDDAVALDAIEIHRAMVRRMMVRPRPDVAAACRTLARLGINMVSSHQAPAKALATLTRYALVVAAEAIRHA